MADLPSTTTTTTTNDQQDHHQQPNNPILSFFSNFLKLFNSPLPFLPPPPPAKKKQPEEPAVVTFPRPSSEESFPSMKLQAEDQIEERNTNPVILWQVYAIGGFLVLRWAWTRWNKRRGRKKPSDENPPPLE